MMKKTINHIAIWTKDIRFWLILLFAIRLFNITNPPIEVAHSWRQTTVTMVARNFYEVDPDILYPRIDISEDLTGITGMEFPILSYLCYLFSLVFGYGHWYGRLINLIVSSIGCYFYYLLIKKYFPKRIAFASAFILSVSLWFCYSRKIMPDTFSTSLVLIGMYYGTNYLEGKGRKWAGLTLYAIFTLLGVLAKLPSGYLMVLFIFPLLDKGNELKGKIIFCLVSILICCPIAWWYFRWVPYLVDEFGLWHFFMGKGFAMGIREIWENIGDTLAHFYDDALKFIGFGIFCLGLFFCFKEHEKLSLRILLVSFMAFLVIIFKSGWTFSHHCYYIIPFVPVMALIAGFGATSVKKKWLTVLILSAIAIENILNQHSDFMIRSNRECLLEIEEVLDQHCDRNDLIVINSGYDPTAMYFAHRKGWVAPNAEIKNAEYLNGLRSRGCRYALILKQVFGENIDLGYEKIIDNEDYTLYKLDK